MNKFYTKIAKLIATSAIALTTIPAYAQLENIGELLQAGTRDANTLAESYAGPLAKGFGAALNSGWYMAPQTHKFLGFDVSVRTGVALIPTSDQTYNVSTLSLSALELKPGTPAIGPTLTSEKMSSRPTLQTKAVFPAGTPMAGQPLAEFEMPDAIGQVFGKSVSPAPMIQVGVGLFLKTDVTVRYIPSSLSESLGFEQFGSISLLGASVKHNLNQWLPGGDFLPVDLAIQAGFNKLNTTANLDIKPSDVGYDASDTYNPFSSSEWSGQKVELTSEGYTVNALVGKDIDLMILGLGVYGGIGIEKATTTLKTPGNFPVVAPNANFDPYLYYTNPSDPNAHPKVVEKQTNVLDMKFENPNSTRFIVGAKVRFLMINVMAEYVIAKYPILNAGVAISIR